MIDQNFSRKRIFIFKCRVAYFTSLMGRPNCKSESDGQKLRPMKIGSIRFFFLLVTDKGGAYVTFIVPTSMRAQKSTTARGFSIFRLFHSLREKKAYVIHETFTFYAEYRGIIQSFSSLNVKRFTRVSRSYLLYTPS